MRTLGHFQENFMLKYGTGAFEKYSTKLVFPQTMHEPLSEAVRDPPAVVDGTVFLHIVCVLSVTLLLIQKFDLTLAGASPPVLTSPSGCVMLAACSCTDVARQLFTFFFYTVTSHGTRSHHSAAPWWIQV